MYSYYCQFYFPFSFSLLPKIEMETTFISTLQSLVLSNIKIGMDIFITNQGKIGIEIKVMFGNCF